MNPYPAHRLLSLTRICVLICLLPTLSAIAADQPDLSVSASRHYSVHSDLPPDQAKAIATHMDTVFDVYQDRFKDFPSRGDDGPMPLYLFRSQGDYLKFMKRFDIDAANTAGMFFVRERGRGLATFTAGRNRSLTFSTLQHEGFHQFAFDRIGPSLPVWVNEGLAQYFEDGILVDGKMTLALANGRRIASVKKALADGKAIDFDRLLGMPSDEWQSIIVSKSAQGALLYDQSWSIVFFLITSEKGKYREAFFDYLRRVGDGADSTAAFRQAFHAQQTQSFREQWEKWAKNVEPDGLNTAMDRIHFLAQGLRFIHEKSKGKIVPVTIDDLRRRLRQTNFELRVVTEGLITSYPASNDDLFRYDRPGGVTADFQLLEPERNDLPPRVTAPGLKPEPTLIWTRDDKNALVDDITWR